MHTEAHPNRIGLVSCDPKVPEIAFWTRPICVQRLACRAVSVSAELVLVEQRQESGK